MEGEVSLQLEDCTRKLEELAGQMKDKTASTAGKHAQRERCINETRFISDVRAECEATVLATKGAAIYGKNGNPDYFIANRSLGVQSEGVVGLNRHLHHIRQAYDVLTYTTATGCVAKTANDEHTM